MEGKMKIELHPIQGSCLLVARTEGYDRLELHLIQIENCSLVYAYDPMTDTLYLDPVGDPLYNNFFIEEWDLC